MENLRQVANMKAAV